MVVPNSLEMLVSGDPLAEIDAALARAAASLHTARAQRDTAAAQRLIRWIDYRLDQRLDFEYHARRAQHHDHDQVHGPGPDKHAADQDRGQGPAR
jgi:hypothetical protein